VKLTPMFRQYLELKAQAGDALLLYRMGDFYELFFEDAQAAAPILGITLTRRKHNNEVEAPMCGVPHHAFDSYLGKLLDAGFRVAVAEQVEDPASAKGLVRREIIRTHTPGTISDTDLLDGKQRCFLAALAGEISAPILVWMEVSTGVFEGIECPDTATAEEELARLRPRELLVPEGAESLEKLWPAELPPPVLTRMNPSDYSPSAGHARLKRVFGLRSLRAFGLHPGQRLLGAAGALLAYVEQTQQGNLHHIRSFRRLDPGDCLIIDRAGLRNLEVERSVEGNRKGSLLHVMDHTCTRMGARLLRDWLVRPSVDVEEIEQRQQAVAEFLDDWESTREIREVLRSLPDLERLASRVGMSRAHPRELAALRAAIDVLPRIPGILQTLTSPLLRSLSDALDLLEDCGETLHRCLAVEPARQPGHGLIAPGFDPELDEARELSRGGKELLNGIEIAEREKTGINSLKIKYNKVFGYYIEISRAKLDQVPENYERRQTLTNAERFITPELKELESRILSAQERVVARERMLFDNLLEDLSRHAGRISRTASRVAQLDVLACFADRARRRDYCRPEIDEGLRLEIRDGRHPVLEELQGHETPFIPNDCILDREDQQIILLTGPNMGGKSTYLRQVALIALMAHTGSFVPAASARIGILDRIFTRVGASDMLARGESTFMVEMIETANILHNAGPRSLVILDEVGRGTATFDGLSLAWAIVEFFHDHPQKRARVLFATHYHELTDLARRLPRLVNRSMAVKEWHSSILFLHRVTDGPSDRSYGIHVAELAGVPDEVCRRAEEILHRLEDTSVLPLERLEDSGKSSGVQRIEQMRLFRTPEEEIIENLRNLELERMTPLDALNLLAQFKKEIDEDTGFQGDG